MAGNPGSGMSDGHHEQHLLSGIQAQSDVCTGESGLLLKIQLSHTATCQPCNHCSSSTGLSGHGDEIVPRTPSRPVTTTSRKTGPLHGHCFSNWHLTTRASWHNEFRILCLDSNPAQAQRNRRASRKPRQSRYPCPTLPVGRDSNTQCCVFTGRPHRDTRPTHFT